MKALGYVAIVILTAVAVVGALVLLVPLCVAEKLTGDDNV